MNMLFIKSGQLENVLNYDDYYMLLFERLSFSDSCLCVKVFLPLLRRFNPDEPVVEKSVIL